MANNLNQFSYPDDSLDFREIIKILLESKKLLLSTLFFFTISSIFYSLNLKPEFKSSTILEIGYSEIPDGTQKLIESPSELISDLKVLIMKNPDNKFAQNVSINSFENKVIKLETTSSSVEQNENLLTEMISYIDERHSNLSALINNQKKDGISHKIELIESEISFLKLQNLAYLAEIESEISLIKKNMQIDLEAKVLKLENELPVIDQEISQLQQVVIEDTNNLNALKGSSLSLERAASSPTLEQIISSYKSKINQLKRERNNSLSEKNLLSMKLDALKKNTLQSGDLFELDERRRALVNFSTQSDKLFRLEQEHKILENQLQMLLSQNTMNSRLIGSIETITIKPKTQLIISAAVLIGFFTGIFLVFIRNFVKDLKESQA